MFAPPLSFSQLTTAFFARMRLGIHRKPYSRLTILLLALSVHAFADMIMSNINCRCLFLGRDRVELSTPALSEQCSNRLSYRPPKKPGKGEW